MAARYSHDLAPAHANEASEPGDEKNSAKAVGIDKQVSGETEIAGEETVMLLYVHPHVNPLASVRAKDAEGLSPTALKPSSMASQP